MIYLLCIMWLLTKWPAARAAIRESSPARTVAHTTLASCRAFSPGQSWLAPCTPSICTHKTTMKNVHKSVCVCLSLCVCVPASKLAEEADWCPLPQCPALLRALCSWCRGPLLLVLTPPLGWCSYCCPLTVLDPGQQKRTGMLTQQDNPDTSIPVCSYFTCPQAM